jgi:NADPH:quinone reductase-like Zn-dependent oxidoreductase
VSFDEAATIPLGLATAAIGMYEAHAAPGAGAGSGGAGLTAPWEAGGRGKYAGQPVVVLGGASSVGQFGELHAPARTAWAVVLTRARTAIQLAKLSGFSPIITTASAHNAAYCASAGSTHVIDYRTTPYAALGAALAAITAAPVSFIFDAVASADSQAAGWAALAPGGTLAIVRESLVGTRNGVADDGSGRRTACMYATVHSGPHVEFATRMYAALGGMLEKGEIKVRGDGCCAARARAAADDACSRTRSRSCRADWRGSRTGWRALSTSL